MFNKVNTYVYKICIERPKLLIKTANTQDNFKSQEIVLSPRLQFQLTILIYEGFFKFYITITQFVDLVG